LTTKDKPAPKLRGHRQILTLSLAAKERRSRANMIEVMLQETLEREPVELVQLDEKRA